MNEWKKFLTEDFDKDKFPFPDAASQEEADAIFTGGFKDGDPVDDKIPVNKNAAFTCGQLNPSQKEVRVTDAVEFGMWMLEGKYEIGGNLGAIVSKDDFIMDGHHRWAGSWLAGGPSTKMVAVQVGLPKDELIPVLAAIGDHFHPGKRNPGAKGGVANIFSSDVNEIGKYIRRLNEEDGITKYMTKAQANAITEKAGGIDALTERFEKHAAQMKEQKGGKIKGLPPREEMPVIKSGEVEDAVVAIEKGQVDIYSPYRPELKEVTELPKEIFTAFEEEIMKSNFWDEDNDYEDLEFDEDNPKKPPQTPATMALTLAMNKALKRAGLDDVVGIAESSGDFASSMWSSATIDVAEDGTPVFMVLMNLWEDFDDFGESAEEAVADISAAFRHELVHLQQLKAQAKSKGVGLEKAFTKMMDDPKQVVDRDSKKYWEVWEPTGKKDKDGKEIINKDGFKSELFMKDYLERHIEIDAHAHQAGENLLRKYGEEKALDTISKDIDLDDPSLPDEVKKYDNYKVDKKKMDKFRSKVYTYIKKFVEDQK